MKKTVILFFSLFVVCANIYASPDKAALASGLSILIPGGGQFYNGKYLKGALFSGAEIGTIYSIYKFDKDFCNSSDNQKRLHYQNLRNNFIWLLCGEIVFSSMDAFIDAKMSDMNKKISIAVIGKGVYVQYKF